MDTANQVQIQDEAVCILHNANTLVKSMNPNILYEKIIGQIVLFFMIDITIGLAEEKNL